MVEAKAWITINFELQKMDIPVVNFSPSKKHKHARVNAAAPLFEFKDMGS